MNYKKEYMKAKMSNIIYRTVITGDVSKIFKICKKICNSKLLFNYVDCRDLCLCGVVVHGKHKSIRANGELVWFIWDNVNKKQIGQWFPTYRKAEESYNKMFSFSNRNKYTIEITAKPKTNQ